MGRSASRLTRTKKKPYKGPFPQNRNLTYQTVRRNMEMPADGPTLNEVSPMDTTQSFSDVEGNQLENVGGRPIQTKVAILNWISDNLKGIIIGVFSTLVAGFCVRLAITHTEQLASHEKDIEHIEKSLSSQKSEIEKLQDKTNDLNTDLRLLEQKVELTNESAKPLKK